MDNSTPTHPGIASTLDAVLRYADSGTPTFPCNPAPEKKLHKSPLTKNGFYDATTDPAQLAQWWEEHPCALIGLPTGTTTGTVVIDVDTIEGHGKDGPGSLEALQLEIGDLPQTRTIRTDSGGLHLYFKHPGGELKSGTDKLGPGLDVKAQGGYVIAPPSPGYTVQDDSPPADLPLEWVDRLRNKPRGNGKAPPTNGADAAPLPDAEWARIKSAMGAISADPRETWLTVGMVLHSTGDARAFDTWREWSVTSDSYDDAAQRKAWDSFGAERGLGLGTLFDLAMKAGWTYQPPEDTTAAEKLRAALEFVADLKDRTKVDAGAPFEPEALAHLALIFSNSPPDWQRTRAAIKHANRDLSIRDLDARIAIQGRLRDDPGDMAPAAVLERFNNRYFVVNENGKAVIYSPGYDPIMKRQTFTRHAFEDIEKLHRNEFVYSSGSVGQAAGFWLAHSRRKQYLDGIVFDPAERENRSTVLNLWQGFAIEPVQGDWSLMRQHIRSTICGDDDDLDRYVIGWLARMVQHPDKPGETALVMRGARGAGKGVFAHWPREFFGQHGIHISHGKHLTGNFNGHLRDCCYVFADEAFFAGDRSHVAVLKALLTEPVLTIEAKYQNAVQTPNVTHVVMASNDTWVVPAGVDERRFCVIDVSDAHKQDSSHFGKLTNEANNGGLQAMLHDLLAYDLSGFDVRAVPQTMALNEQKRLSMDSLHQWWFEVLQREYVYRSEYGIAEFKEWTDIVSTELLVRSYAQYCREHNVRYREGSAELGKAMHKLGYKWTRPRGAALVGEVARIDRELPSIETRDRPPGYKVGSIDEARVVFEEKYGAIDWVPA